MVALRFNVRGTESCVIDCGESEVLGRKLGLTAVVSIMKPSRQPGKAQFGEFGSKLCTNVCQREIRSNGCDAALLKRCPETGRANAGVERPLETEIFEQFRGADSVQISVKLSRPGERVVRQSKYVFADAGAKIK